MLNSKTANSYNLINYLNKNIAEIQSSRNLQLYGLALFATNLVTAFFWFHLNYAAAPYLCFSFFPNCQVLHPFLSSFAIYVLGLLTVLSVIGMILLFQKKIKISYWIFFLCIVIKFVFQISDYRLMGNYHYMSHIINFAYVLLLNKKDAIKLFLVLFYFSAGIIKFNTDWLSGAAMLRIPILSGKWLEIACAYAIFLEMVLSFLLLSNSKFLRLWVLIQFVIFHLFSWHIVGYYYPIIMLLLISAFVLIPTSFTLPKNRITQFTILFFLLAQAYPLIFEPYSALNGRGRLLSLNMLDARTACETRFFLRFENETIEYNPSLGNFGIRIHCDPIAVLDKIHKICDEFTKQKYFVDMDVDHQVRYATDAKNIEQFSFQNVCANPLNLSILSHVEQK